MVNLILIRGLPGSGKSTLGYMLSPGACFSVDQYFTYYNDGVHDKAKLPEAKAWCVDQVRKLLEKRSIATVVVCDTFAQAKDLKPYLELAEEISKVRVFTLIVEGSDSELDLTSKTTQAMVKKFQIKLTGWE
jgi:predicted kinase